MLVSIGIEPDGFETSSLRCGKAPVEVEAPVRKRQQSGVQNGLLGLNGGKVHQLFLIKKVLARRWQPWASTRKGCAGQYALRKHDLIVAGYQSMQQIMFQLVFFVSFV
jgi:hypothetical protein